MYQILYVDDEDDIREVATLALSFEPEFNVHPCSSGQEAVESAQSKRPDIILLDVMMPGMDGPTTFKKLAALPGFEHIPVVFVTARTQPHEVERLLAMGAKGVISKPFDPMTLADDVKTHLRDG